MTSGKTALNLPRCLRKAPQVWCACLTTGMKMFKNNSCQRLLYKPWKPFFLWKLLSHGLPSSLFCVVWWCCFFCSFYQGWFGSEKASSPFQVSVSIYWNRSTCVQRFAASLPSFFRMTFLSRGWWAWHIGSPLCHTGTNTLCPRFSQTIFGDFGIRATSCTAVQSAQRIRWLVVSQISRTSHTKQWIYWNEFHTLPSAVSKKFWFGFFEDTCYLRGFNESRLSWFFCWFRSFYMDRMECGHQCLCCFFDWMAFCAKWLFDWLHDDPQLRNQEWLVG